MRALRVGIVGAGYIARVHSAAYCAIPGTFSDAPRTLALRAVADTAPQRAQALRSAWGWERVCTDWREVTQAVDVDLVDICVPNVFHAPIALDALLHGKHVICEKPLATDLESARAMCDAVSARDLIAQVCFY